MARMMVYRCLQCLFQYIALLVTQHWTTVVGGGVGLEGQMMPTLGDVQPLQWRMGREGGGQQAPGVGIGEAKITRL